MTHKVVVAVTVEPVTLAEARIQLRAGSPGFADDEDAAITAQIVAAREFCEHYTGLALSPQTLEMALDAFPPCVDYIDLDMPPVASVTSVKYTDTSGVEQTFAPASYALSTYGTSRRITLAYGQVWPTTRCEPRAVRIQYDTGYTVLPKALKQAILVEIELNYPGNSFTPQERESMELARDALLNTAKIWSF